MKYELLPVVTKNAKLQVHRGYWDPHKGRHALRGWRLELANTEDIQPMSKKDLGMRYSLTITKELLIFDLNYLGLQKTGLAHPDKFDQVLVYMRQKFAEQVLPLIKDQFKRGSELKKLRKYAEMQDGTITQLMKSILG